MTIISTEVAHRTHRTICTEERRSAKLEEKEDVRLDEDVDVMLVVDCVDVRREHAGEGEYAAPVCS